MRKSLPILFLASSLIALGQSSGQGMVVVRDAAGNARGANVTSSNELLVNVNNSTLAVTQSGNWTARVVGNAGATLDSTVGAGTAPTNALAVSAIYNSSAPAPTAGQAMALQADQAGNLRFFPGTASAALSLWNSGTALNATQNIYTNSGADSVMVNLTVSAGTFSAGAITLEATYDGSTWVSLPANVVIDPTSSTYAQIALPYTLVTSTDKQFLILNNGWEGLRIKLSTAITGTGTVTPNYALIAYESVGTQIVYSPTAANFNATVVQSTGSNLHVNVDSLPSNASVNLAQIAATTTLVGNGASGNGAQRVTISNDNTAIANWGQGATGSAVPSGAGYQGYIATTAYPTAATAGNLVGGMSDKAGRQVVVLNTVRDLVGATGVQSTSASATTLISAGGTGVFNDITSLTCTNESGSATTVTISDNGSGGNTYKFNVPGTAGTGFTINFTTPLPQGTSAAAWDILNSAAVTLDCVVVYAKNK